MKKPSRFAVLVTVAVLLAVLISLICAPFLQRWGTELYHLATVGNVSVKDGVRQNDRIYIKDAYYDHATGRIRYEVVNDSSQSVNDTEVPCIEQKVDGVWEFCINPERIPPELEEKRRFFPAFKTVERAVIVDEIWDEVLPGEYRILCGCRYAERLNAEGEKEWYTVYPDTGFCVVGYFTITEEMLSK